MQDMKDDDDSDDFFKKDFDMPVSVFMDFSSAPADDEKSSDNVPNVRTLTFLLSYAFHFNSICNSSNKEKTTTTNKKIKQNKTNSTRTERRDTSIHFK